MRRGIGALAVVAALAGCGGLDERGDAEDPRAREVAGARRTIREAVIRLAPELSEEAKRVFDAERAGKIDAADAAVKRLDDAQTALVALDEAEQTFAIAARYYDREDGLGLAPAARTRLDGVIARMADGTKRLASAALALLEASRRQDAAAVERARADIERARAALKGYRTDLAISTRLGAQAEPEPRP